MDTMEAEAPTLFNLLARHWSLDAPITGLAFAADQQSLAFASADGRLALAPVDDPDSPAGRYRVAADTGRATIAPRRKPPRPLSQVAVDDGALHLIAFGQGGFLAGSANGRLVQVAADGAATPLLDHGEPVDGLAGTPARGAVVASGGILTAYGAQGETTRGLASPKGPVTALATSADGRWVAWSGEAGLFIQAIAGGDATAHQGDAGQATVLSWSPSGRWLAASMKAGGIALLGIEAGRVARVVPLTGYPAPVRALAWSADSRFLATSGAFRIIAWQVDGLEREPQRRPEACETGRAGLVAVDLVAFNPQRDLIAASYENGMLVVAQPGRRDELVIREAGHAPVSTLHWSADGQHLAFGTQAGEAAIVTFPPNFFR